MIHAEYYYTVLNRRGGSLRVASVMQYLARPEVEHGKALHKQRDMIQLTGSTHCSSIPHVL